MAYHVNKTNGQESSNHNNSPSTLSKSLRLYIIWLIWSLFFWNSKVFFLLQESYHRLKDNNLDDFPLKMILLQFTSQTSMAFIASYIIIFIAQQQGKSLKVFFPQFSIIFHKPHLHPITVCLCAHDSCAEIDSWKSVQGFDIVYRFVLSCYQHDTNCVSKDEKLTLYSLLGLLRY